MTHQAHQAAPAGIPGLAIVATDFDAPRHCADFLALLDHYMQSPTGNGEPMSDELRQRLVVMASAEDVARQADERVCIGPARACRIAAAAELGKRIAGTAGGGDADGTAWGEGRASEDGGTDWGRGWDTARARGLGRPGT